MAGEDGGKKANKRRESRGALKEEEDGSIWNGPCFSGQRLDIGQ